MNDERATGIVLRTHPLTETSLIVHWLTSEMGRIATVAKGARRPASPFRGKLDLFCVADFSFARSRRSELHTLREVGLREMHVALRRELGWVRQAAYGATLIEQATETETPLPGIFPLFGELLACLPLQPPRPLTVFAFEMRLLNVLGLLPDLGQARLSPGSRQVLAHCVNSDLSSLSRLVPSPAQEAELRQFLERFLLYHLGRVPRGRALAVAGV